MKPSKWHTTRNSKGIPQTGATESQQENKTADKTQSTELMIILANDAQKRSVVSIPSTGTHPECTLF